MALLTHEEIEERLGSLPEWQQSGDAIERQADCGDFMGSVGLIGRIAPVAEEMGHHPDLAISWDTVTITLSTHSEGGLTAADFELAGSIDKLV